MSAFHFDFEKQRPRISRREAIRRALFVTSGLVLANHISFRAFGALPRARAKAVIQIWMWGGPSHTDIFDPKPEAGYDYCGPLKSPIETNVPGIRIGELLPVLAKQADKYAIIRSLTHGNNGHETAAYITQTGRQPGGRLVYPAVGAVVSLTKGYDAGYKGLIPPYVVLTEPQGRFDEAGFLGSRYRPFATGGNPAQTPFAVEGIIAPGITAERQKNRRELLHHLDTLAQALPEDPQVVANRQAENAAYDMILGDGAKVFDLSEEKPELRDRYGRNKFGQSCLVARRLIERGIPYVTINSGGWDTHKDNFQVMRRQLPELDKGMGTLFQDLSERGLLDSTIIWWGGEFGRTPKVQWEAPWNGGRGHWGKVFSSVVAGGGFKGGQVIGASDAKGEEVKERPVYPVAVIGSIYAQLGIEPATKLPNPEGLPTFVMPQPADGIKSAGLLKEIMSA
ncbi:MAG TPA: DUF1501 domain-containing protein [Verrucomicrobiae bacterium]